MSDPRDDELEELENHRQIEPRRLPVDDSPFDDEEPTPGPDDFAPLEPDWE